MIYRKDVVMMAVAGLLAASGFAKAGTQGLSIDPTVVTADDAAAPAPLMAVLGKVGMDKPLNDAKLNIYGWVEAGYTYNHRHGTGSSSVPIAPGPFNHELGDHMMLNQVVIRFERQVATDKFDVGATVDLMYGSDAAKIHSTGWGFNGSDATDDNSPNDPLAVSNQHPIWQFDIPQAFVTINLPVGNGLQLMIGKFYTLLGYETVDPRTNAFYSHSWIFSALPFTQTGILGSYAINEQWAMKLGVTRGWDITMEDNNGCAIDVLGQISWVPNKQWSFLLNYSVGPETAGDSSHYRTVIDPILTWQVNDSLKFGAEGLYVYDGTLNNEENGDRHAYGDIWALALYGSYKINDYVTFNARLEKYHSYSDGLGAQGDASDGIPGFIENGRVPTVNVYSTTLGFTITPMPSDPWLKGLMVRPEIRYDFSEDSIFQTNSSNFKDQLTFGADVVFQF